MKKFTANKPALEIDFQKLKQQGIQDKKVERYIPAYVFRPIQMEYGQRLTRK